MKEKKGQKIEAVSPESPHMTRLGYIGPIIYKLDLYPRAHTGKGGGVLVLLENKMYFQATDPFLCSSNRNSISGKKNFYNWPKSWFPTYQVHLYAQVTAIPPGK